MSDDEIKLVMVVPEFKIDPYTEGSFYVADFVPDKDERIAAEERRLRFRCAVQACVNFLSGGASRAHADPLYAMLEAKEKLELAEATISTLREESESWRKMYEAGEEINGKLIIAKDRLQSRVNDLERINRRP